MYTEIAQLIHRYFCKLNSKYEGGETTKIGDIEYYNLQSIHIENSNFHPANLGFYAEVDGTQYTEYNDFSCFWGFPYRDFEPSNKDHDLDNWSALFEFNFNKGGETHYMSYNILLSPFDFLVFNVCRQLSKGGQTSEVDYVLTAPSEMIKEFHEEYLKIIDNYKK